MAVNIFTIVFPSDITTKIWTSYLGCKPIVYNDTLKYDLFLTWQEDLVGLQELPWRVPDAHPGNSQRPSFRGILSLDIIELVINLTIWRIDVRYYPLRHRWLAWTYC